MVLVHLVVLVLGVAPQGHSQVVQGKQKIMNFGMQPSHSDTPAQSSSMGDVIHFEPLGMSGGPSEMVMLGAGGQGLPLQMVLGDSRTSDPVSIFQDLFPPVGSSPPQMTNDMPLMLGAQDPFVSDMMQQLDQAFVQSMLPHTGMLRSESACEKEGSNLCKGATSTLQCLGSHSDELSSSCKQSIGKSVPFLCGNEIAANCDTLEQGVLPCLQEHQSTLSGDCANAVHATQHLIHRVNTQKSVMLLGGRSLTHVPNATAEATQSMKDLPANTSLGKQGEDDAFAGYEAEVSGVHCGHDEIYRSNQDDSASCESKCTANKNCLSYNTFTDSHCDKCLHYPHRCTGRFQHHSSCSGSIRSYSKKTAEAVPNHHILQALSFAFAIFFLWGKFGPRKLSPTGLPLLPREMKNPTFAI